MTLPRILRDERAHKVCKNRKPRNDRGREGIPRTVGGVRSYDSRNSSFVEGQPPRPWTFDVHIDKTLSQSCRLPIMPLLSMRVLSKLVDSLNLLGRTTLP